MFFFAEKGETGLNEEDFQASSATLQSIAEQLNCKINMLREKLVDNLKTAEFLIRVNLIEEDFSEVRYRNIIFFQFVIILQQNIYNRILYKYIIVAKYVLSGMCYII